MKKTSKTIASALLSFALLVQPFSGLSFSDGFSAARAEDSAPQAMTVAQAKENAPANSSASRIAGIVWHDADGNGVMDDGEAVVPGVELTLLARTADLASAGMLPTPRPAPGSSDAADGQVYYSDEINASDLLSFLGDDVMPDDEYTAFMRVSSNEYGWYVFEDAAPGSYVLMANLDNDQRLTVMRSGQSVFDPETWRTVPFTLESADAQLDDMHLGMADDTQDADDSTETPEETSGLDLPGIIASGLMGSDMMGTTMVGGPMIQMIDDSFLSVEEYLALLNDEPQTYEYMRSLFGADTDLTQVTLEQAQAITVFNPTDAGVTDMQTTTYLARMDGLKTINLSNQPLDGDLSFDSSNFQSVTSLNLSGCGVGISIASGALPDLTALHVNQTSSVAFESGALAENAFSTLTLKDIGDLSFGAGSLKKVSQLNVQGDIGDLSIAAGALPNMAYLNMKDATISSLRMEDGTSATGSATSACYSVNPNGGLTLGKIDNWYLGAYALPRCYALDLSKLAATSITFGDNALPACTTLTLSNPALETVSFGSDACGLVTRLVFNNTNSASLQSLSFGANALKSLNNNIDATNGLNLTNNKNLTSISLGNGALSGLTKLTLNNTGLTDLTFLGAGALPSLLVLNAAGLPATSITVPGNCLASMSTLNLNDCVDMQKLTFADDSVPLMTSLSLLRDAAMTEMTVGNRAMKTYANFNLTLSPPKVHTLTIGDDSLNMATSFNVGAYVQNLTVGKNSLNACTSIGSINAVNSPLESLTVGSGSFSAIGYTTLNLAQCKRLTGEHVSIAPDAFPNVKTLTLDNSKVVDLSFLTDGALATVTTLNWKNVGADTLAVPENVLPNLLTLDLNGNAQLTDLSIGAGAAPLGKTLTLTGCTSLSRITCDSGAFGALTTLSAQALTGETLTVSGAGFAAVTNLTVTNGTNLTAITLENGALPKLGAFTATNATKINTLVLGDGALANATALNLSGLPALTDLQIGNGALASLNTLTLTNTSLTSLEINEGALSELLTLTLGTNAIGSSKIASLTIGNNALNKLTTLNVPTFVGNPLKTITIGDNALNSLNGIGFSTSVGAPLETLIVGANAMGNVKTLNLTNNALSTFTAGQDSFASLADLTITGTQMKDMNFLATDGMKNLKRLYMRTLPATELVVPKGSLQLCTYLDMQKNYELASLTFEDNTCPLLAGGGFQLFDCNKLATLIVGDNCLNNYDCWHPAEGWLPVKTMIIGNGSLNAAKRFGFSDVMEEVRVGNNSFGNITTLTFQTGVGGGIKVIPPLRSFIVGENSFRGTANLMNFSNYPTLTEFSIGKGSYGNLKTLYLTGSGITALDFDKDLLPGLTTLMLGNTTANSSSVESLTIGEGALPDLATLTFCTSADFSSPLKTFTAADGTLSKLGALSLANNRNLDTLSIGANALPIATVMDMSNAAANQVSFGQGSAPKLTSLKLNSADIGKLYFGQDSLVGYVGTTTAPMLFSAASLKEFEAEEGALKNLTTLATLPGNKLTSFITRGSALEKVPVLNLGTQPDLTQLDANLLGMTALKELYLDGTAIANLDFPDSSLQIATKLALPNATLKTLRFGANTLPKYAGGTLLLNNAPVLESLTFASNSLPLITGVDASANPLLTAFTVEDGALGSVTALTLADDAALETLSAGVGTLPNLTSLDISHSGMRSLDISAGNYGKLTDLRADDMDAFTADNGGVFTIQNGELPMLRSLWIKGQKAMTTLDVQAGTAGSPTLPNLVDLGVAPLNAAYKAGYEATSLSEIAFHGYTMPKVETIELHNTPIRKIVLEDNSMPNLKMFYPAAGTVFTEITTGTNAAPNLYRFQPDNAQLVSLTIGDGSALNLGNAIPASLSALAGGDYASLAGLNKNTFQSLKLGAGARPGQYLAQLDLSNFSALHTLELSDGLTLPDTEAMIITGTQLTAFPSLDNVTMPKLTRLHLFDNPLSGAFTQGNLPASLVELRLNHTDISSLDLSGSAMPNLEVLTADHSPNLTEVTINTPGSFGRQKMDLFKFSDSPNLASMQLDQDTIDNLMDGMAGDSRSVIELYNTRLGYADLLPLVHPKNSGSNVTITLPSDFLDALNKGQVPDNTATDAQVAMLYSGASYNSGSGDAPLASSVLVDNLYPVYRIHPDIYFAGTVNNQQGPNNSMAGTFEANQAEGGLAAYLDALPESQAQGLRTLLASGFPNKTLGLSANDAACATAEAIAAFLNENLAADRRVTSNFNYDNADEPRVDGLSYAEAPDPLTNPEGYKLYTAVQELLAQARRAAKDPVDHTPPELTGTIEDDLDTPDPAQPNVATMTVRVSQKNINGRYFIADHSSNIIKIEKQTADGWVEIPAPLNYQGDVNDLLLLTIDNTDKTAAITLDLKAVKTVGLGEYYDVTDVDNGDYQNDKYKSDYIAVRGVETTEFDTPMLLRAAEAIVTISYKWEGQASAIKPADTVHFANAKPGDKVYIGTSDPFSVSAPAIAGFVSPEADCGEYLTITGEGDKITFYYKKPISISGATAAKTYNGQVQTLNGIVTDLVGDTLIGLTGTGSGENAGDYAVTVSGTPGLASGKDFDALYQPTITDGTLTITASPLTIGASSGTFEYDATAHTVNGYQILDGVLWTGDSLSVTLADNQRTDAGSSEPSIQSYTITSGGNTINDNYAVQYAAKGNLTVSARPLAITPDTKSFPYNGQEHAVSYTATGLLPGHTMQVTLADGTRTLAGTNAVRVASVGVSNGSSVTANYAITSGTGEITVHPAAITVKAGSQSFLFTGEPQAVTTYEVSGDLASTDLVTSVELLNSTRTEVGNQSIDVGAIKVMRGTEDVTSCYTVTPVAGKITVVMSDAEIIITAKDATARYDGQNHWGTEYTVSGLKPGEKVQSLSISGEGTDVGTYPLTPKGVVIVDAQNKVVKSYEKITYVNGSLTITPRPATIVVNSQSFPYDGREHTVSTTATGLVDGHTAAANLTGATRKDPNRYDVTFDSAKPPVITEGTTNVTKNYSLTLTPGTITIIPKGSVVRVTAKNVNAQYDGTKHGQGGYDVTGLLDGDHIEGVTISGESMNAGTYALIPSGAKIMDAHGNEVTSGYQGVEYVNGKLTIAKRSLSVSVESKAFPYDGQPHRLEYTVSGDLLQGDVVTGVVLTGNAMTIVGDSNVLVGRVSISRGTADVSHNYDVTRKNGVIQITTRNDLAYRIEYYYAGALDSAATVLRTGQTLGATISAYPDKAKTGYSLSRVQYGADYSARALVVGLIEESNIIRVYYEQTNGAGYTVEHRYQNAKGDGYDLGSTDTVGGLNVGDVITEVNQRILAATLPGFEFERSEGLSLTLVADKTQNVIRVYYKRAQNIAYSVEYYYNGEQDTSATARYNGHSYGEVIRKYADKCMPGYQLQSVETLPFTLSMHSELNVIRVYYDLVGGGELPQTIVDTSIPLGAGVGSLNVGDSIE